MNTIIEKIRAEVNRLKKEGENGDALAQSNNDYESHLQWEQQIAVANGLLSKLSILSDLEKEEKPINVWSNTPIKAKVKETGKYIMGFTDGKGHLHIPVDHNSFLQYNIDELEFDAPQEHPVCEGLEEEIRSYLMTNRIVNHSEMGWKRWGEQIARHFAQWGAEHRGSSEIPNDLEEAAKAYADDTNPTDSFYEAFKEGALWMREQMMDEWLKDRDGCFWDGVEEGKKAMREQMMKEAVEGEVCYGSEGAYIETDFLGEYNTAVYGNPGDKVRIIIVKED